MRDTFFRLVVIIAFAAASALAQNSDTDNHNVTDAQLGEIVQWLGVAVSNDDIMALAKSISAKWREDQRITAAQQDVFVKELASRVSGDALTKSMLDVLRRHYNDAVLLQIHRQLSTPLAVRARNFDIVMEMPGALERFERWQQTTGSSNSQREEAVLDLDRALRQARFSAVLQTAVENALRKSAAEGALSPPLTMAYIDQRTQALREVSEKLNLYTYRFMRVDEIQQLANLYAGNDIQQALDLLHSQVAKFFLPR